jgi:lactate permease
MMSAAASVDPFTWGLALLPIAVLVGLVASGRLKTTAAGVLTLAVALLVAGLAFGAPLGMLGYALGKGLWTGLWILCVVWAALLLHGVCQAMGMGGLGSALTSILPRSTENVLVAAWIFPSFVQGVAGFGTPIVVSAPLLVAMGVSRVRAVAMPLVGYHWAVGFGSVGSSFYMGALTARLGVDETHDYAAASSLLLGVNAILAGLLVAWMHGRRRGLRDGWRLILMAGPAMALGQGFVAHFEPGVGALAGGTVGLVVVALRSLHHHTRGVSELEGKVRSRQVTSEAGPAGLDSGGVTTSVKGTCISREGTEDQPSAGPDTSAPLKRLAAVMLPYVVLLVVVLAVLLPPWSRTWAKSHLLWGPSFPQMSTTRGATAPGVESYQSIALLSHPGSFILFATLSSVVVWQLMRRWPRRGLRQLLPSWFRSARRASWPVLLLASVATVMSDAGMVRAIAVGVADVAGHAYPAMAGLIGAVGSFTTGSTTTSNALFAGLQADVARILDVQPSKLLAAQLAGGNVGNSVAPVVMVMGAAAVGARDEVGKILRMVVGPAAVLLLSVVALSVVVTYAL